MVVVGQASTYIHQPDTPETGPERAHNDGDGNEESKGNTNLHEKTDDQEHGTGSTARRSEFTGRRSITLDKETENEDNNGKCKQSDDNGQKDNRATTGDRWKRNDH